MQRLRKAISHYITLQENIQCHCNDTIVKGQQLQSYCYTNVKGQQYPVSRPLTETYGDLEVLAASSSGITKGGSKFPYHVFLLW